LIYAFSDRERRDNIRANLQKQRDLKQKLGVYGEYIGADVPDMRESLAQLRSANKALLEFALARYHELVEAEL
jgi:hypothetical protein